MTTKSKVLSWGIALVALALALFIYFKFYFVFGQGVKAGELNQLVYKGWIWKTYEGRLIQAGFNSGGKAGNVQSNEFNFSVKDRAIADTLMRAGGKMVELRYKEYNGILPWRGMQRHVVYEIIAIKDVNTTQTNQIPIVTESI